MDDFNYHLTGNTSTNMVWPSLDEYSDDMPDFDDDDDIFQTAFSKDQDKIQACLSGFGLPPLDDHTSNGIDMEEQMLDPLERALDENPDCLEDMATEAPETPEIVANIQPIPVAKPVVIPAVNQEVKRVPIIIKPITNANGGYTIQKIQGGSLQRVTTGPITGSITKPITCSINGQTNRPITVSTLPSSSNFQVVNTQNICKITAPQRTNGLTSFNAPIVIPRPNNSNQKMVFTHKLVGGTTSNLTTIQRPKFVNTTQRIHVNAALNNKNFNQTAQKVSIIRTLPRNLISVPKVNGTTMVQRVPVSGMNFRNSNSNALGQKNVMLIGPANAKPGPNKFQHQHHYHYGAPINNNNFHNNAQSNKVVLDPDRLPPQDYLKINLSNVVARLRTCCHLDLREIALNSYDVQYKNDRQVKKVVMRMKDPKCTAYMWSSGKIVCTGSTSAENSRKSAIKFVRRLNKINIEVSAFCL